MINLGHQNSSWRAGVVVDFVDNFTGPVMNLIKDLSEKASTSFKINPTVSMPRIPKLNVQPNIKVNPESVTKSIDDIIDQYKDIDRMLSYAELSTLTSQLADVANSFKSLNKSAGDVKKLINEDDDAVRDYINSLGELLSVKDNLDMSNLDELLPPNLFESLMAPLEKGANDLEKTKDLLEKSVDNVIKAPARDAGFFAKLFAPLESLGNNTNYTGFTEGLSGIHKKLNDELGLIYDDAGDLDLGGNFVANLVVDKQGAESVMSVVAALESEINDVTKIIRNPEDLKGSLELLDADQVGILTNAQDRSKKILELFEKLGDLDVEHLDPETREEFNKIIKKTGGSLKEIYDQMNDSISEANISYTKHTNIVGKSLRTATRHLKAYDKKVKDISKDIEDSALNTFIQQPAVKKVSLAGAAVLGGSMLLSATNEEQLQAAREMQLLTEGTIKPMDASFRLSEIHDIAVELNVGEAGDNLNMMVLAMKRYEDVLDSAKLKGTEFAGQSMKDFSSMMAVIVGADNFSADLGKEIMTGLELHQGMKASVVKQIGDNDDMFRRAVIATLEGVELHEMDQATADIIFADTPEMPLTDKQMKEVYDKLIDVRKAQHDHFTESAKVMGNTFQNLGSSITEFSYNYGLIGPAMKGVNRVLTEANIAIHKFAESQSGATKFAVGIGTTAVASLFAVGKAFPAIAETTAHTLTAVSVIGQYGGKLKSVGGAALTGAKYVGKLGGALGAGAKLMSNFSGVTKLAGMFTNLFSVSTAGATLAQNAYNGSMWGSVKALVVSTATRIKTTAVTIAQAVATWAAVVPTWALAAAAIGLTAALLIVVGIGYLIYKNWDKITAAFKTAWEWVKNLANIFYEFGKNLLQSLKPVQWLSTAFGWLMDALGLTGKEGEGFMDKLWRIAKLIFYLANPIGWLIGSFKILNKVFSGMEDSSNPIIRTIGKIGKIFVNFLNPVGLLINAFKWLGRIWKGSGDESEGFIAKITRVGKAILMVASPIGWITAAFNSLSKIFTKMEGSSNPVISTIGRIGKILVTVLNPISLVTNAFNWLKSIWKGSGDESEGFITKITRVGKAILMVVNPIGNVINVFNSLNNVFSKMEGSSSPIIRTLGTIGKIFINFLNPIGLVVNAFKWLGRIWKGSGDESESFMQKILRVGKIIFMVATPIGSVIGLFKMLTNLLGKMAGSSNPVISTIGRIGGTILNLINPINWVVKAFNWLKSIWKGSGDESEGFIAKILRIGKTIFMISSPIGWIIGAFNYLFDMFTKMAGSSNPVISTIGKIGSVFTNFLNPIKLVSSIFQGLSRIWKGSGDESEGFIAKILRVGKTIFMLGTPLGLIITGITKLLKYKGALVGFFKGIGSGAKNFIGNIGSTLKNVLNGIQGFMGSVVDFFRNAFADLVNMFIGWINNAINIANKVPGVNIDLIPTMGENGEQIVNITPEYEEVQDKGLLKKIGTAIPFQDSKVVTGLNKISKTYVNAFKEPEQTAKRMWSTISDTKSYNKVKSMGTNLWSNFETTSAGQTVKNLANQYVQAFKEPKQAVKQFWANLSGGNVDGIGSKLASAFDINKLKDNANNISKFYVNAFKDPEQTTKQMWDTLSNNKVVRSTINTVDKLWGRFTETKIGRQVDQNVRKIWNTLGDNRFVESYVDSANHLFSSLGEGFKEQGVLGAFNKFVEEQKVSFGKMWGSFKDRATYRFMDNLFNKVVTTTNMSGLNIGRFFKRIFAPVSRFVGKVINLVIQFFKDLYSAISDKVLAILDDIWQAISSIGSTLSDVFGAVFDFLSGIFTSLFTNIVSWFKSLGSGLVSLISTVFNALLEWLQSPFVNTYKFAMNIFNLIYSGLASIFTSIGSKLKEPFVFISGLVSNIFSSLFNKIVAGFNFISGLLKKPFVTVGNFIGNIFSSLFTKIVSSFSIIGDFLKKPFIAIKDIIHGAVDFMRTALIDLVNMFISGINKVLETANKLPGVNIDLLPMLKSDEQSFTVNTTSDAGSSGSADDGSGLLKQIGGFFSNIGSELLPDIGSGDDGGGLFKKAGKFFGGIGSSIMSGIDSMADSVAPSSPVLAMPNAPATNYAAVGSDIINRDNRLVNPDLLRDYELAMSDFSNHRMQNENIRVSTESATSVNGSVDVTVNFSNMPAGSVAKVESKGQVNTPKVRSGSLSGAQKRNLGNSGGSNS